MPYEETTIDGGNAVLGVMHDGGNATSTYDHADDIDGGNANG